MTPQFDCLAITGGIGSGKSTVLELFKKHGYMVINTDTLAHNILKSSSPYYLDYSKKIDQWLGTDFHTKDFIERSFLRDKLNTTENGFQIIATIAKPYLIKAISDEYDLYKHMPLVFEVPLLIEAGLTNIFSSIIVVTCDMNVRIQRIKSRDLHLSDEEITHRIHIQSSDEEKIKIADFVLDNSGTELELNIQFSSLLEKLTSYKNRGALNKI